jgi:hypothetical protein
VLRLDRYTIVAGEEFSMDTLEMACHTWALSGNPLAGTVIHRAYESLTNELGMPYVTGQKAKPHINDLVAVRQKHMEKIAGLAEQRTELMGNKVYICGGFGPEDVCPMHLWLEDHTARVTYDTFINQPVVIVDRIGLPGHSVKPGCEGSPFAATEIARGRVDGFTRSQIASIAKQSERRP